MIAEKHIKILKVNIMVLMRKLKWRKAFHNMKAIIEIKTSRIKPSTYLEISKQLGDEEKINEAIEVLSEASKKYPDNSEIQKELANLYFKEKNWTKATAYLSMVDQEVKAKLPASEYAAVGKSFRIEGKFDEAEKYLTIGLSLFPNNIKILTEQAEKEMALKKWTSASKIWGRIIESYLSETPVNVFIRQAIVFRRLKSYSKSEAVLLQGLSYYKNNAKLHREFAQSAILQKNWDEAIRRLELIVEKFDGEAHLRSQLDLGMINEFQGKWNIAEKHYNACYIERPNETMTLYPLGYRKIVLFDNGESRIEYYKKLSKVDTLCITYDSINIVWSRNPFGFDFLKKQNLDIIAVRRRKSTSYQQDLSYDDFYDTVKNLTEKYKRTVSYGFSLGGYSALYYGSKISDQVLAISPRNSIHPVYGMKHTDSNEFNHTLSQEHNANISPIIVYDPKNIVDSNYIENDLLKSYPNSQLVKCPYAGHSTANYFSQIGVLKKVILSVLNDEDFPEIDKKLRVKSPAYLTSLARFCFKRNKLNWALMLVNRSLEIKPEEETSKVLKTKILKKIKEK